MSKETEVKLPELKSFEECQKAYNRVCLEIGDLQYKIGIYTQQIQGLVNQGMHINSTAMSFTNKDKVPSNEASMIDGKEILVQ